MTVQIIEATIHQLDKLAQTHGDDSVVLKPRETHLPLNDVLTRLCDDLIHMYGKLANSNGTLGVPGYRLLLWTSITAICKDSCTCGAARPTPSYSCIVSTMSSISFWIAGLFSSERETSFATCRRIGLPSFEVLRIDMGDYAAGV